MFVRNAVLHVNEAMQAALADEPQRPRLVAIEHEVFAEEPHLANRIVVELRQRREGNPVAAHQFATGRAGTNAREPFVLIGVQHSGTYSEKYFELRSMTAGGNA